MQGPLFLSQFQNFTPPNPPPVTRYLAAVYRKNVLTLSLANDILLVENEGRFEISENGASQSLLINSIDNWKQWQC
jgi:hypothetical protein